MSPDYKPILRLVDAIPSEWQGQPVFLLKDPVGLVEEILVIPQSLGFLLALMDGNHDLRDLQVEATKKLGVLVPLEEIQKIVEYLNEKGFLWSEKFEEIKNRVYEKWLELKVRPMAYANQAYPLSSAEAKFFVEDILNLAQPSSSSPRILIAPHIDIKVGARAFGESYRKFKPVTGSRIIVLGVGHHLDLPYSVLTKNLASPFGIIKNDRGGVLYLNRSKRLELYPDHIAHKLEHSIEFQALFLHYLLKDEFVMLPILIGPLFHLVNQRDLVRSLIEGLIELIDEKTYIVLGIDFCHLGIRYGDLFPATDTHIEKALQIDKIFVELSIDGEEEKFLEKAEEYKDMKICGLGCLYFLNLFLRYANLKGSLEIYYQEGLPFGPGSVVSVVSAGYSF
ncbi:MAG: AmmeMemoRadiSam system protein B [Thermodesulfobacterium sp.]|nr:AmmeMemoRadiSam system protein B [Thermodesulfobacterium sp.]